MQKLLDFRPRQIQCLPQHFFPIVIRIFRCDDRLDLREGTERLFLFLLGEPQPFARKNALEHAAMNAPIPARSNGGYLLFQRGGRHTFLRAAVNMALEIEQGQRLHAEALADRFGELVEMRSGGAQRTVLYRSVGMRGEVAVEQLAGGDRLGSGGNHRNLSASCDELFQRNAFGNDQAASLDESKRLIDFDALGLGLRLGQVADGEVVPSPLKAEGAV